MHHLINLTMIRSPTTSCRHTVAILHCHILLAVRNKKWNVKIAQRTISEAFLTTLQERAVAGVQPRHIPGKSIVEVVLWHDWRLQKSIRLLGKWELFLSISSCRAGNSLHIGNLLREAHSLSHSWSVNIEPLPYLWLIVGHKHVGLLTSPNHSSHPHGVLLDSLFLVTQHSLY